MKCVCDLRLYKYYLKMNYSDCDYCEHGICYLDYINLWIIIIIGTIT